MSDQVAQEIKKMNPLPTGEICPNVFAINNEFVNFFLIKLPEAGKFVAIDFGANNETTISQLKNLNIDPADICAVLLTHTHGDHTASLALFDADIYAYETDSDELSAAAYTKVADGDVLDIHGLSVKCIHTPGHADNHVSYLVNNEILFAGDALSLKDGQAYLFNSFFNKNDDMQKEDIRKLSEIAGVKYVISSHYGYVDGSVVVGAL
ncbi:MAG: MBL fold metallo-hydrolase [Defluviitaleaceae bacterium]|nr:MBL fold metallo-hydrolase [Defluviitaleaceae bacterium]